MSLPNGIVIKNKLINLESYKQYHYIGYQLINIAEFTKIKDFIPITKYLIVNLCTPSNMT